MYLFIARRNIANIIINAFYLNNVVVSPGTLHPAPVTPTQQHHGRSKYPSTVCLLLLLLQPATTSKTVSHTLLWLALLLQFHPRISACHSRISLEWKVRPVVTLRIPSQRYLQVQCSRSGVRLAHGCHHARPANTRLGLLTTSANWRRTCITLHHHYYWPGSSFCTLSAPNKY